LGIEDCAAKFKSSLAAFPILGISFARTFNVSHWRAARKLAKYGNLPRCRETEYSRPAQVKQLRTAKAEKVFKETARITTDSAYPIVTHFFTAIFLDELVPKIEK